MRYTIESIDTAEDTIVLHSTQLRKWLLNEEHSVKLCIGALEKQVVVRGHGKLESLVCLSHNVLAGFTLPGHVEYEIRRINDTLYIGPVLGLLIRGTTEELTKQRIKIYKNYLIDYERVNGLVLLFAWDGIDVDKKTVHGFFYNPTLHEWVKGVFPFPSAVFVRRSLRTKNRNVLQRLLRRNYFNSHVFNKWEMWEWFSNDDILRGYVANTVLARDKGRVKTLLNEYGTIYIKPFFGMQGTGIFQLSKRKDEYELSYRLNGKNIKSYFESLEAVEFFLESTINLDKYIAQQRIPLIREQNRVIDFRVIAVKNEYGKWSVPGIVAKFGEKDSIVSNISSGGKAEKAWETIRRMYKKDSRRAFLKYKEMENLALRCCEVLENIDFNFGYIGIDMGIDEDKNLWVIEINNRSPDMTIALDAKDPELYYRIKAAPLHYAKWLAGFGGV